MNEDTDINDSVVVWTAGTSKLSDMTCRSTCNRHMRSSVRILLTVAIICLTTVAAQNNTVVNHNSTAGSEGVGVAASVSPHTAVFVVASGSADTPCCGYRTHLLTTQRMSRPSASLLQDVTHTETSQMLLSTGTW